MINYIFLICSIALIIVNANYVFILKSKAKKITTAIKVTVYFNYIIAIMSIIVFILMAVRGN